jgi:hypothetical protein
VAFQWWPGWQSQAQILRWEEKKGVFLQMDVMMEWG